MNPFKSEPRARAIRMDSLLLCAECYTWVLPVGGHCPDCLAALSASTADPTLEELGLVMGELLHPIGEGRVLRKAYDLPGTLYVTTEGFFFVPHVIQDGVETQERITHGSLFWNILALIFPPLRLFLFAFPRKVKQEIPIQTFHPQQLLPEDSHLLPQLLMDHPGAFFLPRSKIQSIEERRGIWWIDRPRGRTLLIQPDSKDRQFQVRMNELRHTRDWRVAISW
ncbi:MAG: hypothetical protein U0903_00955 [Planctomycetales bacterium]